MIILSLLTLFEGLDLDLGFSLFSLGVKLLKLFDVCLYFKDVILILPFIFVPFIFFLSDWIKVLDSVGIDGDGG